MSPAPGPPATGDHTTDVDGEGFPDVDEAQISAVARAFATLGRELDDVRRHLVELVDADDLARPDALPAIEAHADGLRRVNGDFDEVVELLEATARRIGELRAQRPGARPVATGLGLDGDPIGHEPGTDGEASREAGRVLADCATRLAELRAPGPGA